MSCIAVVRMPTHDAYATLYFGMCMREWCAGIKMDIHVYVNQKEMGTDPPAISHGTFNLQNDLRVHTNGMPPGAQMKEQKENQAKL